MFFKILHLIIILLGMYTTYIYSIDPQSTDSELITINFGRSNCMFHKKGNELVIVDAGAANYKLAQSKDFINDKKFTYIGNLLKDCTLKGVIITHAHHDHYNILEHILKIYYGQENHINHNINVIIGGSTEHECIQSIKDKISWENVKIHVYDCIKGKVDDGNFPLDSLNELILLGDQRASFYKPSSPNNSTFSDKNAYSLIFHLDGIIYTGDANQNTVGNDIIKESITEARSKNIANFAKETKAKKVLVMAPHHGSTSKGSRKLRNALVNALKEKGIFIGFLVPNTRNEGISKFSDSTLLEVSCIEYTRDDGYDVKSLNITEDKIVPYLLNAR